MKKILIMYATAGIGHKKASLAVKKAFDEIAPGDCEITIIDSLDYTNDVFKKGYLGSYLFMVNKMPSFWGMSYYLTDNYYFHLLMGWWMRRLNNAFNSKKLEKFLVEKDFDVIISTHFFGSEVIASIKRENKIRSKLITVVTDYQLHSWWVVQPTDMYVVAGEDARNDLLRWKVAPEKISVLGIPVEPVFSKPADPDKIRSSLGFGKSIFTILVIGGGFGVGPIEDIVNVVNSMSCPIQLVTVCGHNEELVKKLEALKIRDDVKMKIFGFIDNVYEYMGISDILISKSGGITVSESLAKELPMLIIAPIMGQETRNSDVLIKHGSAVKIADIRELKGVLEDLVMHKEKIEALRANIRLIKKPRACYDVANLALDMAGKR